jgi:conjugal transfer pilus assembly protein TraV
MSAAILALRRTIRNLWVAASASAFAGCVGLAGTGGSSHYGCKAPEGVKCDSVSGTYYNSLQNNLPSQRPSALRSAASNVSPSEWPNDAVASPTSQVTPTTAQSQQPNVGVPYSPKPLRSQTRVLRLWYKPWEDADRDLYDQGYVYVQVEGGRWLIEHTQRQIRDAHAPVRPLQPAAASPAQPDRGKGNDRPVTGIPSPESKAAPLVQRLRAAGSGVRTAETEDEGE